MMRHIKVRDGIGWFPLPELLERAARLWPETPAFRIKRGGGWDSYTYREALDLVRRLARCLVERCGLRKGDKFAVVGENRPEWPIAYMAILWAGGIVVPLDPRLTPKERGYILGAAKVKGVVASGKFTDEMLEHKAELPHLEHVVSMDPHPEATSYHQVWQEYPEGADRAPLSLDDVAVILFTSGTPGAPKGVVLTHKNISSNVDAVYQAFDVGPEDRFYSILPLHHVYEATAGFLFAIAAGATINYASSLRPDVMRQEMKEVRPTLMVVVPLILEKFLLGIRKRLAKLPRGKRAAISLLKGFGKLVDVFTKGKFSKELFLKVREELGLGKARYIVSGGAALPRWVSKGLEEMGFPILQGYGLSEASPVVSVNPPWRPKNESVGWPLVNCEVKIWNPNEEGVGEIAVRAPFVMQGYYENPEATREALTPDGWLLTGDMGYIDREGYIYITGRKKAVIVTKGGKNIFPEELEEKLTASELVEEALVIGGVNPATGEEEVQAIIFPNLELLAAKGITSEDGIYEAIDKVVREVNRNLADYKRIRRFAIRFEEFPKTTTRKIKRHLFKGMYIEPGQRSL